MQVIVTANIHRKIFLVIFTTCVLILMISYYDTAKLISYQVLFASDYNNTLQNDTRYLVSSSKCKILNLDPFSKEAKRFFRPQKYKPCSQYELLTYVTKEDNIATVHIDHDLINAYTRKKIKCCYSNVTRQSPQGSPDNSIKISDCAAFKDNVTMHGDATIVRCSEEHSKKHLYENVHASVRITDQVRKKINNNSDDGTKSLSVLLIGIDSVSRLNLIRTMPNTYRYLKEGQWLTLDGYNKMDDNTFPNLMAIFTGFNQSRAYEVCNPKAVGMLDKCPLLWYTYRNLGYVTAYAEDEGSISTFNYNKKGFSEPPTDYYFRPYVLASERLPKTSLNGMNYCTGPETAGERIMNLVRDFTTTFKDSPNFGVFWMNSFSHNDLNDPSMMDNKVRSLLIDLEYSDIYNGTMVVLFSDHGMRFGDIRLTETGWLEERLPFIYFSFPGWFPSRFPKEYANFKGNRKKLTTPYDVHMTLQHLLVMLGLNHTVMPSDACPNCRSLFEEIPSERSCHEASIEQHWCTCFGYSETELGPTVKDKLSYFLIKLLHRITSNVTKGGGDHKCAKYTVDSFISTRLSTSTSNGSHLLVSFKTEPKALFETTLRLRGVANFSVAGDVSRLDAYNSHSKCVSDAYMKKYCYCVK